MKDKAWKVQVLQAGTVRVRASRAQLADRTAYVDDC